MDPTRTEIDGVPVFWVPGENESADEYYVTLWFRVGRADESLARSGITHLVEHLALHHMGDTGKHHNGIVDATTTMFVAQGNSTDVTDFLGSVCQALGDLPLHRLHAEKQILRTEDAARSAGLVGEMLLWRYGPSGFGLPAYPEFGIDQHSAENVTAWARRWFTRGNAALGIIGGPPPVSLRLALPDGPRIPIPEPTSALAGTPAFFNSDTGGAGLHSVIPRQAAGGIYAGILARRLHRTLRLDRALSYTPWADYSPRDATMAHVTAFADGLAENHPALVAGFIAEVESLASDGVSGEDVREAVTGARERLLKPETVRAMAISNAVREVTGGPGRTYEDLLAELDAVTAADIQASATATLESALLMLPGQHEPPTGTYVRAPWKSADAVEGRVLTSIDTSTSKSYLLAGPSGVTKVDGSVCCTIRYDSAAAVLTWPDGARRLFGIDGFMLHIEPRLWSPSGGLPAEIDRCTAPELLVRMPERAKEDIPRPPAGSSPGTAPLLWPPPRPATGGLRAKLNRVRQGDAWDDPELAAALRAIERGDLNSGRELLARSRDDHELRALRAENLSRAAVGHGKVLAELVVKRPDDPDLLLWYGATRVKEAWEVRTPAPGEDVSDRQFEMFWLILAGAHELLSRASAILPDDPVPWDHLHWRAIGLQADRSELDQIWNETRHRAPDLFSAHYSRAQAVSEKWYGSRQELTDFAESTADTAKPGDPITAILAAAYLENEFDTDGEMGTYLSAGPIQKALGAAADKWMSDPAPHCRSTEAHHLFGAAFYYGGNHNRARQHLACAANSIPETLPWGYFENPAKEYLKARKYLKLR